MTAICLQVTDNNDFVSILGLYGGSDNIDIEFGSDGNTLRVYGSGSANDFATSPTLGKPFAVAISADNDGVTVQMDAYWRHLDQASWQTVAPITFGLASIVPIGINIGNFPPSPNFGLIGDIWNVKIWDRKLTADELLLESFYAGVKLPASLNSHFRLDSASDLVDRSGQGRDLSSTGGLTDSAASWAPWKAGARVIRRADAATFIAPKIHQLRQQGFL